MSPQRRNITSETGSETGSEAGSEAGESSPDGLVQLTAAMAGAEEHNIPGADGAPGDSAEPQPNRAGRGSGTERKRGRQPSARSLALPQATRDEMRRVADFFHRATSREVSGLTQPEIVERIALRYARMYEAEGLDPAAALERGRAVAPNKSQISRLNNRRDLEAQSDFEYRKARDILEAVGYTMSMLDEAMRLTPEQAAASAQNREAAGVALTTFNSLSPYGKRMAIAYLQQLRNYEMEMERDRAATSARIDAATHLPPRDETRDETSN